MSFHIPKPRYCQFPGKESQHFSLAGESVFCTANSEPQSLLDLVCGSVGPRLGSTKPDCTTGLVQAMPLLSLDPLDQDKEARKPAGFIR